jgi:hypothetical protein
MPLYVATWFVSLGLAFGGCTLPALLLGVVLIVIIFRHDFRRLAQTRILATDG